MLRITMQSQGLKPPWSRDNSSSKFQSCCMRQIKSLWSWKWLTGCGSQLQTKQGCTHRWAAYLSSWQWWLMVRWPRLGSISWPSVQWYSLCGCVHSCAGHWEACVWQQSTTMMSEVTCMNNASSWWKRDDCSSWLFCSQNDSCWSQMYLNPA